MTVIKGPWAGTHQDTAQEPARPSERRRFQRLKTLLEGKVFASEGVRWTCAVRDLSEAGARLSVPAGTRLPRQFHLMAPRTASGHACAVVWRTDGHVGVAFDESYELNEDWPLELEVRQDWTLHRRVRAAQIPAETAPTKA